MHIDLSLAVAGLLVGFVVGLTGMGGGALMTPILVVVFNVQPLAAVSSDLVASFFMRPVGAAVHLRQGTVNRQLVKWLVIGSVPSAFCGVLILRAIGTGRHVQDVVQVVLGVALLVAAGAIVLKAFMNLRERARGEHLTVTNPASITVKPLQTVLIGALGGLVVGSIPGVYLGARISARAPARLLRRVLAFVLLASGLKLVQVGNVELGIILLAVVVIAPAVWMVVRATDGLMLTRSRAALAKRNDARRERHAS